MDGPYSKITINNLSADEINTITKDKVESIIKLYLSQKDPNYSRLRWFYRRLGQLGLPVALEYTITNFFDLLPVISDVCNYIVSINHVYF